MIVVIILSFSLICTLSTCFIFTNNKIKENNKKNNYEKNGNKIINYQQDDKFTVTYRTIISENELYVHMKGEVISRQKIMLNGKTVYIIKVRDLHYLV